jgi:hypothetical protein
MFKIVKKNGIIKKFTNLNFCTEILKSNEILINNNKTLITSSSFSIQNPFNNILSRNNFIKFDNKNFCKNSF